MAKKAGGHRTGPSAPVRTVAVMVLVGSLALIMVQTAPGVRERTDSLRARVDEVVVVSSPSRPFGPFQRLADMWDAQKEVEALRVENRQLALWRDAAISMAERIERYETMLDLMGEPLPSGVSARIVSETNGPFAETCLANAGRFNNVREGAIAVNTRGLVGRVIRVGDRSSRILLVTDFNSRVPVMGEISGVRAILSGGQGDQTGRLNDKPENDPFVNGEVLLTTGEGGAFPPGLAVGQVVQSGTSWAARLAFADAPLDFVRILPPAPIPAPSGGIDDTPPDELPASEPIPEGATE